MKRSLQEKIKRAGGLEAFEAALEGLDLTHFAEQMMVLRAMQEASNVVVVPKPGNESSGREELDTEGDGNAPIYRILT